MSLGPISYPQPPIPPNINGVPNFVPANHWSSGWYLRPQDHLNYEMQRDQIRFGQQGLRQERQNLLTQLQEASRQSFLNRQFQAAGALDQNFFNLSQLPTQEAVSTAVGEYTPARDFYRQVTEQGLFSPEDLDRAFSSQFQTSSRGQAAQTQAASNAQRASGARSTGLLSLAAGQQNLAALGQAGQIRNNLSLANAESRLSGAAGLSGLADRLAALRTAPTQESAGEYYRRQSQTAGLQGRNEQQPENQVQGASNAMDNLLPSYYTNRRAAG